MDDDSTIIVIGVAVFGVTLGLGIGVGVHITGLSFEAAQWAAEIAVTLVICAVAVVAIAFILRPLWTQIGYWNRKNERNYPAFLAAILAPIIAPLPESFSNDPIIRLEVAFLALALTKLASWLLTNESHPNVGTAIYYGLACCVPLALARVNGIDQSRKWLNARTTGDWIGLTVIVLATVLLPGWVRHLDQRHRDGTPEIARFARKLM
jgi:hypothetical protein